MKNLLIASLLLTSLSAMAVTPKTIKCSNLKGFLRPTDTAAVKLTKHFNVKTCNRSARFNAALKKAGIKIIVVSPTKAQIAQYGQSRKSNGSINSLFNQQKLSLSQAFTGLTFKKSLLGLHKKNIQRIGNYYEKND